MPFDYDAMMAKLAQWTAEAERQNREVEAMLDELDPDWRVHQAEQQQQKRSRSKRQSASRLAQPEIAQMPQSNKVDSDVMKVLRTARCEGNRLFLPPAQLDRKLYERVNEILTRLGGKWKGGKTRAHVFDDPPGPLVAEVVMTGIMPPDNPLDFYRTPDPVIARMMELVPGYPTNILEPSAGDGAIVKALMKDFPSAKIDAIEMDQKRANHLRTLTGVDVIETDFLTYAGTYSYDLVVMNPPFSVERDRREYISHIQHAYALLAEGGALISVAPVSLEFRDDLKTKTLRELVQTNGFIDRLDSDAFEVSGTSVATTLVYMTKPARKSVEPTSSPIRQIAFELETA